MARRNHANQAADFGLRDRLLNVMRRSPDAPLTDAEFNDLAFRVFARQFAGCSIYRRYCEARGVRPERLDRWIDIPAVPTDAFKAAPLVCGDPETAVAVFRTSGTTAGSRSRGVHYLLDTALYAASLRAGFREAMLPDQPMMRILSLVPRFADLPDSSLSFMIEEVLASYGAPGSGTYVASGELGISELFEAFETATEQEVPVLLVGTSFAFVHLLDAAEASDRRFHLPRASRAMDTGGFKGRSREVSRSALYATISDRLGVPASHIVNEYGMTEMSSQFYDGVVGSAVDTERARVHRGPTWVRSVAVDPETLEPLPHGEIGILRHLDLANFDSVSALQTSDLGSVSAEGIRLLGRDPTATPRGCSIAMDELLGVVSQRRAAP